MSEDNKDQGFTKEQLEELQIDSALGGDIPFIGMAGSIGKKVIPEVIESVAPYVKKAGTAIKEAIETLTEKEVAKNHDVASGAASLTEGASTRVGKFQVPDPSGGEVERLAAQKIARDEARENMGPIDKVIDTIKNRASYPVYIPSKAEQMEMASLPDDKVVPFMAKKAAIAAGTVVVGLGTAANYISDATSSKSSEVNNKVLSDEFRTATADGSDKAVNALAQDRKSLDGAVLYYQSAKNGLLGSNGQLSETASKVLGDIANRMAKQIEAEGPQVFNKPPQNLMQQEETMHQEHAR